MAIFSRVLEVTNKLDGILDTQNVLAINEMGDKEILD